MKTEKYIHIRKIQVQAPTVQMAPQKEDREKLRKQLEKARDLYSDPKFLEYLRSTRVI